MKTIKEENEARRREIVEDLLKKPHPGNSYNWFRIQNLVGNVGDYDPTDAGEPPKGAEWE